MKGEPANKRQAQFVATKILTRHHQLRPAQGDLTVTGDGITKEGGIDFQIVTVLLPGGEVLYFL